MGFHALDILIFNWQDRTNPHTGGAETNLHEIFGRLVKRGHRVTLVASSWTGAPSYEVVDGIKIYRVGNRWTYPMAARTWYRQRQGGDAFDVVIEDCNKIPLATPSWIREPVVLFVHHLFGRSAFGAANVLVAGLTVVLERLLLPRYADVPIVTVSDSTTEDIHKAVPKAHDVTVIHNGVGAARGLTSGASDARPFFLYIGRLQRYKRVDLCIRAIARLLSDGLDARLVIAGRGPDHQRLERVVRKHKLTAHVEFLGYVDESEKADLMGRAVANVITSVKEGWGMSILDAGALGTPSIASNSPGLRDAVRDQLTGLLVPHGDVRALANAMKTMLRDHAGAARMGAEARSHAEIFSWAASADQFETLLRRVAGR